MEQEPRWVAIYLETIAGRLDSGASSPLLQTEMMPEEDGCVCPYCHRDYRKVRYRDEMITVVV